MDSSLLDLQHTSTYAFDFEIPSKGFRSLLVDLAVTRFHQHLIVDLVPVDTCKVRMYKTFQISQEELTSLSRSLQNVVRVFILYLGVLDWNPKCFRRLGPSLNSAKTIFMRFSIGRACPLINRTSLKINSFSYSLNILETWLETLWTMSNTYSRCVFVLGLPTYTN